MGDCNSSIMTCCPGKSLSETLSTVFLFEHSHYRLCTPAWRVEHLDVGSANENCVDEGLLALLVRIEEPDHEQRSCRGMIE
jgi:hypothetical protein